MKMKGKTMSTVTSVDVIAALGVLQGLYPNENRVSVWTEYYPRGDSTDQTPGFRFVAVVGDWDSGNVYGYGKTPHEAASDVISKAGDRDPKAMLLAKIDKARAELAKLEAELNPPPVVEAEPETQPEPASV